MIDVHYKIFNVSPTATPLFKHGPFDASRCYFDTGPKLGIGEHGIVQPVAVYRTIQFYVTATDWFLIKRAGISLIDANHTFDGLKSSHAPTNSRA